MQLVSSEKFSQVVTRSYKVFWIECSDSKRKQEFPILQPAGSGKLLHKFMLGKLSKESILIKWTLEKFIL